jgi:anti-anti-sigma factor
MINSTLEIVVNNEPLYRWVDLFGNLDSFSLKAKKGEIIALYKDLNQEYLVINLQNVNFINSESIGLLLMLNEQVTQLTKKFILIGAKKNVYDVLNVIGLTKTIAYFRSKEDFLNNIK